MSIGKYRRDGPSTYPLQKSGPLAKVRNPRSVVVGEHLVSKNRVGNLRGMHKVHLEQSCLQMPLLGLVVLQRIEQERSRRLDHILGHKHIDNL